jgi:hypothetical protein
MQFKKDCLIFWQYIYTLHGMVAWDSAVGIATGYGLDHRRGRSSSPGGGKNFQFSMSSRPVLGPTQPPIQWAPGVLSPEVKLPEREADHSPPTRAEVKKSWVYTCTPPYFLMVT